MSEHPETVKPQVPDMNSLLGLIRNLVDEVYPNWSKQQVLADTLLERELGLDSMARVELCARIGSAFGIHLENTTAISASTANELHKAIVAIAHGEEAAGGAVAKSGHLEAMASDLLMGSFGAEENAAAVEQRRRHTLADWLFALYAVPVFVILALLTWLAVVLAPLQRWRQRLAKTGARMLFRCTFTPFEVTGLEHLEPGNPAIIVANHASYLDGFIITAALNIPVQFIVKSELAGVWFARILLQRFGVEFVERFDASRGAGDITGIVSKSRGGRSFVFFPEGTFITYPGLQPFRMGAFVTAARSGAPVIPVAISGSRTIQSGSDFFPRRGRIRVTVCKPLLPEAKDWQAAVKLKNSARSKISRFCGEPDLLTEGTEKASGDQ